MDVFETALWPWLKSKCLGFVNNWQQHSVLAVKEPSRHRWSSPPHLEQQKGKRSASSPGSPRRAPPLMNKIRSAAPQTFLLMLQLLLVTSDSPPPRESRWRRSRLRSGSLVPFWLRAAGGRGGLKLQGPNESQKQEGVKTKFESKV